MDPGTLLVVLIPFAPLVGGLAAAAGGPLVPAERCHLPVAIGCGLSFAASLGILLLLPLTGRWTEIPDLVQRVELYRWFGSETASPTLDVTLHIDALSLVLIAAVSLAATLVAVYAAAYDAAVGGRRRLFAEIAAVHVAAVMLLTSDGLVQLFVFWQVLSVAAWVLAGSDTGNDPAVHGAGRVLLTNLAGDALLLAGILLCGTELGALSIASLGQRVAEFLSADVPEPAAAGRLATVGLTGFLFAAAALVRCGQFPAFGWLTDAGRCWSGALERDAAAPVVGRISNPSHTPASIDLRTAIVRVAVRSALVQTVILPTGVFLILRVAPLLVAAPDARWMLLVLGSLTAVIAAAVALYERDDVQVLLFTAASQLGLMLAAAATGEPVGIAGAVLLWLVLLSARTAIVLLAAGEDCSRIRPVADDTPDPTITSQNRTTGWLALLVLAGGLGGQHAAVTALWSAAADAGPAHGLLAALVALSIPLTACALVRLWLEVLRPSRTAPARTAAAASRIPLPPRLATIALIGIGLVLVVGALIFPERLIRFAAGRPPAESDAPLDGLTTLVTLLLAAVGFSAGWLVSLRRNVGDSLRESQPPLTPRVDDSPPRETTAPASALLRLAERRFYANEVFFLLLVFPVRAVAQFARFFEWLIVDALVSGLPRRVPNWAGRLSRPLEGASGPYAALALILAAAVLLIVLVAG